MIFDILSFGFMQNAIVSGIAISLICSTVGLFLVLRKFSLFGDALAHSAFGGVALGLFLGFYPLWAAYAVSILSALGLTKIRQKYDISGDAIVAILLSSGIAVGIVLISLSGGFSIDIFSFLFGSVLLVSTENVIMILGLSAAILIILITGYKKFMYITFSEEQAQVSGIPVQKLNYLLIAIAGVTVVTSMQLVGVLLVSALFVIPNVTAMMFKRSFKQTIILSMSFSVFSTVAGILISYPLDIAPSGMVVLLAITLFIGSLIMKSAGMVKTAGIQKKIH
ncbi:MAG: iron chelate uptake ABC transporter family permease subunit [Candidatus Nitrosopelagicus sp.]|jgi:zinc transport system permease protein|nr:iron chelate uptake ABC transporter family permease subunit [Candidatus Nitrosopelagicus sp.]